LDPLNALQTQLKDEIIRRQESTQPAARSNNSMGDRGMLQADWDVVWMRMRKIMEAFHAAPFHTIWTAHADTVQDSMTGKMAMEPLFQGTKTKNEATRIPGIVGYIRMVEHNGETVPGVQFAGGAGALAGDRYRNLGARRQAAPASSDTSGWWSTTARACPVCSSPVVPVYWPVTGTASWAREWPTPRWPTSTTRSSAENTERGEQNGFRGQRGHLRRRRRAGWYGRPGPGPVRGRPGRPRLEADPRQHLGQGRHLRRRAGYCQEPQLAQRRQAAGHLHLQAGG